VEASHETKGLLRLTMACNERCPFCNVPVEDYARPTPPDEEIAAQLDAFVASGERTLTISGGEPTLYRRRLVSVVRSARTRGVPFVELQTNAVLVTPDYAAELAEAGVTSAFVSLLSDLPDLHDALAGLPGAFPRCLAGIDALLDAGISVTLNPVTARTTQERLPDYVGFVAARLPRVRSISVSAVQPHGRGAKNLDLLPDYAILGPSVREARARAARHGIELLNPYCGLPLCVGWEDGRDVSVEAIEAEQGGWRERPGVENTGDKRQGRPCGRCALRTRCGGAWHAYWDVRGGSGLRAPVQVVAPWIGEDPETSWWWTSSVRADDPRLQAATDVALDVGPEILDDHATLRALRAALKARGGLPQRRLRLHVGVHPGSAADVARVVELAAALGAASARILAAGEAWERLATALSERHPDVDVGVELPVRSRDGRT
jgi:MoaA/NifB/PqqE/SkfB family radical SAM enzyme